MPFWYGGMSIMPLLMPLIVGAVIYFLHQNGVFQGMCGPKQNQNWLNEAQNEETKSNSEPLEILKKRYAAGEISTEEYQQIKQELKED